MKKKITRALLISIVCLFGCTSNVDTNAQNNTNNYKPNKLNDKKTVSSVYKEPKEYTWEYLQFGIEAKSQDEIIELQSNILQGKTPLEISKLKKILFDVTTSLESDLYNSYMSLTPIKLDEDNLKSISNKLRSVSACFEQDEIKQDINAVRSLIIYSIENEDLSGIFLAHNILSDITYWIIHYKIDLTEFSTWLNEPMTTGAEMFYGVSKTWGYDYPDSIKERIENIPPENVLDTSLLNEINQLNTLIEDSLNKISENNKRELISNSKELELLLKNMLLKDNNFSSVSQKIQSYFGTTEDSEEFLIKIQEAYEIQKDMISLYDEEDPDLPTLEELDAFINNSSHINSNQYEDFEEIFKNSFNNINEKLESCMQLSSEKDNIIQQEYIRANDYIQDINNNLEENANLYYDILYLYRVIKEINNVIFITEPDWITNGSYYYDVLEITSPLSYIESY